MKKLFLIIALLAIMGCEVKLELVPTFGSKECTESSATDGYLEIPPVNGVLVVIRDSQGVYTSYECQDNEWVYKDWGEIEQNKEEGF